MLHASFHYTPRRSRAMQPPATPALPYACRHRIGAVVLACALACAGSTATAQSSEPAATASTQAWKLSGFGTAGVLHVDSGQPWRYARDLTQRGAAGATSAAVDSRVGLQLQGQLSDRLDAVAQLVVKDRPQGSSADAPLEWAFLGWQLTPGLKLRLGRTSPDLFLLADVRNVGFAYPWVRPSVEYYGWMPFSSMDGADLTLQWRTDAADWRGKLALGRIRSTIGVIDRNEHVRVQGDDTLAATLSRDSGGLLLKASYLRTRMIGESPAVLAPLEQGLQGLRALPVAPVAADAASLIEAMKFGGVSEYAALGAQYEKGPWTAHAEASRVRFSRGVSGGDRGYVSLGYRWSRVTAYAVGARSRPDTPALTLGTDWVAALAPLLGPAGAQQAAALGATATSVANQPRFDQSTRSLGLRWDALDNLAIKVQLDRTHVHPNGSIAWRNSSGLANRATVLSLTADMVF